MAMNNKQREGFTLTELMVVMAIMAIIMAAGLAGFNNIEKNYRLDAAVNQFRNDLALARQHAVLNNTSVAVLIPTPGNFPAGTGPLCLRAYALYDLRRERYISSWTYLPDGVVFDNSDENFDPGGAPADIPTPFGVGVLRNNFNRYLGNQDTDLTIRFPETSSTFSRGFKRLLFTNDGSLYVGANVTGFYIRLKEGVLVNWPDGGNVSKNNAAHYMELPEQRHIDVAIYNFSGRTGVIRYD